MHPTILFPLPPPFERGNINITLWYLPTLIYGTSSCSVFKTDVYVVFQEQFFFFNLPNFAHTPVQHHQISSQQTSNARQSNKEKSLHINQEHHHGQFVLHR